MIEQQQQQQQSVFGASCRMEQHLSVVVALVLVSLCKGWPAPNFCHQKPCPEYQLVGANQDFEERRYVDIDLITTTVDDQTPAALMAARSRLESYRQSQKKAGYEIPSDTWPGMITVTEGEGDPHLSYSWFLPPGTARTNSTDPSVAVQTRPGATVYVRVFGELPSIESGRKNAALLRAALGQAGKAFDQHTYTGAGYDGYFSLWHHNEIWISAA
ncbi:hypothetical protein F2P81_020397 [Scophthalmus maximus]|uniref:Heme-binding protein 2-like n=1 Tax=Scophthalmus maximus TaxID=52904 RepID=A0A6A4RXU4_SCOMX|nr:hypothetical protein F2P81_020397 [Scophthalmus maximus]